jgi:hypothetical protein
VATVGLSRAGLDRDQVSRLGHEWCNGLIPVTGRRSNELGFALLWSMMSGKDAAAHQWWADPLNPHVWAISDDSGTLYATIGTRVPAWGQLAEVTIGHPLARTGASSWCSSETATATPGRCPPPTSPTTAAGADDEYHGHRMASSLATLCDNAVRGTGLERFIASTPAQDTHTRRV